MKNSSNVFILMGLLFCQLLLNSCGEKNNKVEKGLNFTPIDSLAQNYELENALNLINQKHNLTEADSIRLNYYKKLFNRILEINPELNERDQTEFIHKTVNFLNGRYSNTFLYIDTDNKIYSGKEFINGKIGLIKNPQKLILSCSYDDEYYNNVFTEISIKADNKKILLAKGSPANGFRENGKIKTRPFEFELTDNQLKTLIKSKDAILVFTTAKTYNDRAFLNGTVWDIKGGEPISYNDTSSFLERKRQILSKGGVKTFEVEVNDAFRARLKELYEIHEILKRNKVKASK